MPILVFLLEKKLYKVQYMQNSTKFSNKNASNIQWAPANFMLKDNPAMDWDAIQGGVEILVVNNATKPFTFTHGEVAVCCIQA